MEFATTTLICRIPHAALLLKIHPTLLYISVGEFIQNYYKRRPINNVLKSAHTKTQRVTNQFVS